MSDFRYKCRKDDGTVLQGTISAVDERTAFHLLKDKGLAPFELTPLSSSGLDKLFRNRTRSPNGKARARYIRQMATLLVAGLPLLEAMDSLQSSAEGGLAEASGKIAQDLRQGARLSAAITKQLPTFPIYVSQLAELGEATGNLPTALGDAAARMEQQEALKSEIQSALTYPAFLAATGVVITLFMFFFVVPRFDALLAQGQGELPLLSQIVLGSARVAREYPLIGLGSVAALVLGAGVLVRSKKHVDNCAMWWTERPSLGHF